MPHDIWDEALEYEMLFGEEDESIECPHCGREIKGNEEVQLIDKKSKLFKCPGCGKDVKINERD